MFNSADLIFVIKKMGTKMIDTTEIFMSKFISIINNSKSEEKSPFNKVYSYFNDEYCKNNNCPLIINRFVQSFIQIGDKIHSDIQNLNSQISELQPKYDKITSKVKTLESENSVLSSKLSNLESEVKSQNTKLSSRISELEADIVLQNTTLSNRIYELESQDNILISKALTLKVSELESQIKELNCRYGTSSDSQTNLYITDHKIKNKSYVEYSDVNIDKNVIENDKNYINIQYSDYYDCEDNYYDNPFNYNEVTVEEDCDYYRHYEKNYYANPFNYDEMSSEYDIDSYTDNISFDISHIPSQFISLPKINLDASSINTLHLIEKNRLSRAKSVTKSNNIAKNKTTKKTDSTVVTLSESQKLDKQRKQCKINSLKIRIKNGYKKPSQMQISLSNLLQLEQEYYLLYGE